MKIRSAAAVSVLVFLLATPYWGWKATWTETFDKTLEEATYRMGTEDEIVPAGGNPGAFLHDPAAVTAQPTISRWTGSGGLPIGAFRLIGVSGLGIDVNVFSASLGVDGRPVSLVLHSNMNTPADPLDVCEAIFVGKKLQREGTGWKTYTYHVPTFSLSLPNGWVLRGTCGGLPPDAAWQRILNQVDQVRFHLGDPRASYPMQVWDIGVDNPTVYMFKGTGPSAVSVSVIPD